MAKQADRPILPGVKPGTLRERDLSRLRELLEQEPLTFKDARRRFHLPTGDASICTRIGWQAWQESPASYASHSEAITLAHQVYWEMYDER